MGRMRSGHVASCWGLVRNGFVEEVVFEQSPFFFFFFSNYIKKNLIGEELLCRVLVSAVQQRELAVSTLSLPVWASLLPAPSRLWWSQSAEPHQRALVHMAVCQRSSPSLPQPPLPPRGPQVRPLHLGGVLRSMEMQCELGAAERVRLRADASSSTGS